MAAGSPGRAHGIDRGLERRGTPTLASLAATMKAMAAATPYWPATDRVTGAGVSQSVRDRCADGEDDGECGARFTALAHGDNPDCCYLVIVPMSASFSPPRRIALRARTGAQGHPHAGRLQRQRRYFRRWVMAEVNMAGSVLPARYVQGAWRPWRSMNSFSTAGARGRHPVVLLAHHARGEHLGHRAGRGCLPSIFDQGPLCEGDRGHA